MNDARVLEDAPWLRSGPAARVLKLLNGGGEEARVVGGAVRNALLNIPIGDIDIATTALPTEVIRRAKAAGIKSVPTGIDHGTVTLVVDTHPFEITTLRQDTETFGRKAKVAFGRDWVVDAERRDFTINGLSVDAAGIVHDHVGGLDDIAKRRVRFIGEPDQRISEDYLRILRFFRIHAAFGEGQPDRAGYLACIRTRAGLASLSAERVRMEMVKLVVADGAAGAIAAMIDSGLLQSMLGGVPMLGRREMVAAEHLLALAPIRFAGSARSRSGSPRMPGARYAAAARQCRDDGLVHGPSLVAARRHGRGHGATPAVPARPRALPRPRDAGLGALQAATRAWRQIATLPERWSAPKFPLKAADFIARGIAKARARTRARAAEDAWLAADFPLDATAVGRHRGRVRAVSTAMSGGASRLRVCRHLARPAGADRRHGAAHVVIGGLAGYGTGALMPLVLVPIVGAEPVVPIISLAALFTNSAAPLPIRAMSTGAAP